MIEITKGNPTSEEIAALVAVLILASGTTVRLTSSTAEGWRRSAPFAEVNPCGPSRRDRRWRAWYAGWSSVGPMHVEVVQVGAQRELHAQSVRVLGEGPGGSGGVGAHEDLSGCPRRRARPRRRAAGPARHRAPRCGRRRCWSRRCRRAAARPAAPRYRTRRDRGAIAAGAARRTSSSRRGPLLVRVHGDQRGIQVEHHQPVGPRHPGVPPRLVPSGGARGADRGHRRLVVGGQPTDQPRHRRIRGHRSEHLRLRAHQRDVGRAVPAQRDRDRQIGDDLARIVHRQRCPPRRQRLRQRPIQPDHPSRLTQQHPTRGRHQRLAVGDHRQRRT